MTKNKDVLPEKSSNENNIVLTARDISQILGLGRDSAYALMRSKGFPSFQINRRYFVTADNLKIWLDNMKNRQFFI